MTRNEIIKIDGMICHHCVRAVETELEKLNIINAINASGYEVIETKHIN